MRILLWFTVGFAAICAAGCYFSIAQYYLMIGLCGLVCGILLSVAHWKPVKVLGMILVGVAIGSFWFQIYHSLYLKPAVEIDGKTVSVILEVTDYSVETEYGTRVETKVTIDGKDYHTYAYLKETEMLQPGDRIEGEFYFRLTTKDGIDGATFHQSDGAFLLAYGNDKVTIVHSDTVPDSYIIAKFRKSILDMIESIFPADTLAFAKALLLGDTGDLPYETDTEFKTSGIRHIIAVSGLHISILCSLVYSVVGKRRFLAFFGCTPLLILFAALAGFTPSVLRACVMQLFVLLASLTTREYDSPTALSFSVLLMLVINPMVVTSVSLQLSVSCMIGMLMMECRIRNYLFRLLKCEKGFDWKRSTLRIICLNTSVTLSAMLITTPLSVLYFGAVSMVSVATNILSLWAVSYIFYGIMLACTLGWIWLPLGKIVAWIISWLVRYVALVAKTMSALPFAAVYSCSIYVVIWILFCYLLFAVFWLHKFRFRKIMLTCTVVSFLVCMGLARLETKLEPFRVSVIDVGQGQSILFQCDGRNYLVDCGGDSGSMAADRVSAQLLSQGIRKLDGLILTHYDVDHSAGVPLLLTRIGIERMYLPDIPDDGEMKSLLSEQYADKIFWVTEDSVLSGDWGKFTMFTGDDLVKENNCGLCILFQRENCDILITGDRNVTGERELLKKAELPQLELLIAGHHGAADATSYELLSETRPATVAISVSKDNSYGHPSYSVLESLKLFQCRIKRTDIDGTIIFRR